MIQNHPAFEIGWLRNQQKQEKQNEGNHWHPPYSVIAAICAPAVTPSDNKSFHQPGSTVPGCLKREAVLSVETQVLKPNTFWDVLPLLLLIHFVAVGKSSCLFPSLYNKQLLKSYFENMSWVFEAQCSTRCGLNYWSLSCAVLPVQGGILSLQVIDGLCLLSGVALGRWQWHCEAVLTASTVHAKTKSFTNFQSADLFLEVHDILMPPVN